MTLPYCGNSRGGYAIRNYIQNGGGAATVSHAILGGTPNHGVWAIKGFREGSEFAGSGPFLTALNAPKNAHGDEVNGPVRWLTIRSDKNDKFAQPDGVWIGAKGTPTNVTFEGPELKGAPSVVMLSRPRGYFDAQRDKLVFDGQTPPPGVPPTGAGVSISKIRITQPGLRPISAEFNGERITGQTWRAAENRLVVLELSD